jgi:hypothetical protein
MSWIFESISTEISAGVCRRMGAGTCGAYATALGSCFSVRESRQAGTSATSSSAAEANLASF